MDKQVGYSGIGLYKFYEILSIGYLVMAED